MNTNSIRREVLIGVAGFVVGMVLSLAIFSWHPSGVPRLQVDSRGTGWNHVALLSPADSEFIVLPRHLAVSVGTPVLSPELRVHTLSEPPEPRVVAPPVISVSGRHPYHLIDLRPVADQPKN